MLIGAVASFLSLYAIVPQVLRAARTRSVEGVSWSSIMLSMSTMTLWAVYAFAVADQIQIVNNALALVLLAALAVVVVRAGVHRAAWVPVLVVFATGLVAVWVVDVANSFALAMVGTTVSSVRMLPQARLAISGAPLWGLCPWSTLFAWSGSGLWLAYALVAGDLPFALCSLILLAMQSVVVFYRLPLRRTLASLAGGRLGHPVARVATPLSVRLPQRGVELAA